MKEYIDAAAFKEMILCADAALHANIQQINELNVFPVPDSDTGTNMCLTLNNAANELRKKNFTAIDKAADCVPPPCCAARAAIPALSCPFCSAAYPSASRASTPPVPWSLPAQWPTAWTPRTRRS